MSEKIALYYGLRLLDINAEEVCEWNDSEADIIRVCLPASVENEVLMQREGFFFADRTIGVSINLLRSKIDFAGLVRLPIEEGCDEKEEMLRIAVDSFPYDRRFNILLQPDSKLSRAILSEWLTTLERVLICRYKGSLTGFLVLRKIDEKTQFVHLAAVDAKYRMTGAALSLYAHAATMAKNEGFSHLDGRISTQNQAVMNLYSSLGAVFSQPRDIFLKEVRHAA